MLDTGIRFTQVRRVKRTTTTFLLENATSMNERAREEDKTQKRERKKDRKEGNFFSADFFDDVDDAFLLVFSLFLAGQGEREAIRRRQGCGPA